MQGREVFRKLNTCNPRCDMDAASLNNGVYLLKAATAASRVYVKKLVIVR